MENKEYTQTIEDILGGLKPILDDTRKCILGHDQKCLEKAENERRYLLRESLPLAEEVIGHKDKSDLEKRFITILPSLQQLAISIDDLLSASRRKLRTDTFFTEKASKEIQDVLSGVEDMARDTKDILSTGNPHLKKQVHSDQEKMMKMIDEYALDHQQRLIVGLCSPKASYLYLDIIGSLRRIVKELAFIAEKA